MPTETSPVHLAVDLGASSGRVLAGKVTETGVQLEEIHRFSNGGLDLGKRLVWNLLGQWEQITEGLSRAAGIYGKRVRSVGADTWGVDYVLLDRQNDMLGPCMHYRDGRTAGVMEKAFQRLSRSEIFRATGLQFMEINTAYQLLAMRLEESPQLDIAERFLMVPDFLHWQLSGEQVNEFTNASTTQLLDVQSGNWSRPILDAFEIPTHLFSEPVQPGHCLGNITRALQMRTRLDRSVEVIVPATHDTGSAVLAVPADSFASENPDWCYISCGTWSLMGVELARPVLSEACQLLNFTNEGGVNGSVRLLKNIAGLWIVQQCREQWKREGHDWSWEHLLNLASQSPAMLSVVDTDDSLFLAPDNMPEAVCEFCRRTGQPVPQDPGAIVRCALESLALRYRLTLSYLEQLVGHSMKTIHMVGGGVQNRMLCQFAADACGRPVVAGPVEATAIGNILMQAIGSGQLSSIQEARRLVRLAKDIVVYEPQPAGRWDEGYAKLQQFLLAAKP
ncbi:rhamnulokinase [Aureliella helgolandensis]|uniref:Rhamnulokinase n=1 Tax=Aureliella helgolandensis TaxID=2527968 RepID=A0A518G5V6_9BACT|nr:rhamnulokinase family protein [Aureliella helgolandensis]QDV23965.1 Rhamnulokinase [Aureliella helgolandensis]